MATCTGAGRELPRDLLELLRAGAVIAPGSSTSAGTRTDTAVSRSVPLIRTAPSSVSSRRFESTGSVVRVGMLPATAASPSCSFSRVMVNFMSRVRFAIPEEPFSTGSSSYTDRYPRNSNQ